MAELKRTSEVVDAAGKAHDHILYLTDQVQQTQTSFDDEHAHLVVYHPYVPEQPAQTDPNTGQELVPAQPAQEAYWEIQPAEDGHTHDPADYVPTQPKSEDEPTALAEAQSLWRAAEELERDAIDSGIEAEDYYCGKQWDESDKQLLEGQGRAALTINVIESKIDTLSGYQREQRTDISYKPVEDGDQRACDLLNIATKVILDRCYFAREQSQVFVDIAVPGRGIFVPSINRDKDLRGDIVWERLPWHMFKCGPHNKLDASDAEHQHIEVMASLGRLKQLYPDKADDIDRDYETMCSSREHDNPRPDAYSDSPKDLPVSTMYNGLPMVDIAKKEYRLVQTMSKKYTTQKIAVDTDSDFYFPMWGWKSADINRVKTIPGLFVFEANTTKIRIRRWAGNVLLTDEDPADLPSDGFPTVVVYGKKRGNMFWGKVEAVKDSQMEINKRASQAIDIGNTCAVYGYGYDDGTFLDSKEEKKFRGNATRPGFVTKLADTNRPPYRFEGTNFPSEIVGLMQQGLDRVNEQLNITPADPGANTSGAQLMTQQKQKMAGNEFLFDNLTFSSVAIGRMTLRMIQKYYKPARLARLVMNSDKRHQQNVGDKPLGEWTYQEILEILANADLEKMDVEVSESTYGATARTAIFMLIQELMQSGAPIPPEMLVQAADIPADMKQDMLEAIARQQDAQSQAQSSTRNMELEKTLIAQGQIPPAVAQEFGLTTGQPPADEIESPAQPEETDIGTDQAASLAPL